MKTALIAIMFVVSVVINELFKVARKFLPVIYLVYLSVILLSMIFFAGEAYYLGIFLIAAQVIFFSWALSNVYKKDDSVSVGLVSIVCGVVSFFINIFIIWRLPIGVSENIQTMLLISLLPQVVVVAGFATMIATGLAISFF